MTTLITPQAVDAPQLGRAPGRVRLARLSSSVWRALEVAGQVRARRHLLDFADSCEANQPELAKELRAASSMALMG